MFSVVIPLYNKAPYIKNTITSVLSQTHNDYEVIIIDDGSTDGSGEIIAGICDPRVRLIRQDNGGVSAARNRGIELAKANYVAFLDADDIWMPNHLETLKILIDTYPKCGLYATSYSIVTEYGKYRQLIVKGNKPIGWHTKLDIDGYLDFIIGNFPFLTTTICISKPIIQDVGLFDIYLIRGEDQDMWLRIALKSDVAFINRITAIYNQGSTSFDQSSLTSHISPKLQKHASLISDQTINEKTRSKLDTYYTKRVLHIAQYQLLHGKKAQAQIHLKEAKGTSRYILWLFLLNLLNLLPSRFIDLIDTIYKRLLMSKNRNKIRINDERFL